MVLANIWVVNAIGDEISAIEPVNDSVQFATIARDKVKVFAHDLKSSLLAAIQEGGLEKGITVCKDVAPSIADSLSTPGWKVSRTSLRVRNINNAPDNWERSVLQDFDKLQREGSKPDSLTRLSQQQGQTITYRYMQAIPTGNLCLSCHGEKLSPKVQSAIDLNYPADKAIGFKSGDIRGAFSLKFSPNEATD
ncbi:MAG: hypothetical protein ACJA13_000117 [Paraglaciecola sp.]|jgi:hypothetical protein